MTDFPSDEPSILFDPPLSLMSWFARECAAIAVSSEEEERIEGLSVKIGILLGRLQAAEERCQSE